MRIPKIIHIVWIGTQRMPDQYIENMLQWAKNNPDFQVNLWVDRQGTDADVFAQYDIHFPVIATRILQEELTSPDSLLSRITIKDITEEGIADE